MKSFLKGLCLILALMSTTGLVVAKESVATQVDKSEFANKVVNLNKADANTLRYYLKGIGEVKADAIIQYRKENGKFSDVKDLLKVPGIGKATLDGLKKNVSTSRGETTAPKLATSGKKSTRKTSSSKTDKKSSLLDQSEDKSSDSKSSKKSASGKAKLKADEKKSDAKPEETKSSKKAKKSAKCDPAKDKDCKAKISKKASKEKKSTKSKKTTSKSKSATKKPKSKAKKSEKPKKKKKTSDK